MIFNRNTQKSREYIEGILKGKITRSPDFVLKLTPYLYMIKDLFDDSITEEERKLIDKHGKTEKTIQMLNKRRKYEKIQLF